MITLHLPHGLVFNCENDSFEGFSKVEAIRYLKGLYTNFERFEARFLNKINDKNSKNICNFFKEEYPKVEAFSYADAFAIKGDQFRALVFGSVNVPDMINNLGHSLIKSQTIERKLQDFDNVGKTVTVPMTYETHSVDGSKLGVSRDLSVVHCWCTTTNKEHWVWIDSKFRNDPESAISSMAIFHENIIPHIKAIRRQGDVFLLEMNEDVLPEGNTRYLTKEEYFSLVVEEDRELKKPFIGSNSKSIVLESSSNTHVMHGDVIEVKEIGGGILKLKVSGATVTTHNEHGDVHTNSENILKYVQQELNPITNEMQNAFD